MVLTDRDDPINHARSMTQTSAPPLHPLADDVEAFLEATGMTPTFFGREAMNDPQFVTELRAGRDLRGSTERRARSQMTTWQRYGRFAPPTRSVGMPPRKPRHPPPMAHAVTRAGRGRGTGGQRAPKR